jgi:hypothetical protein
MRAISVCVYATAKKERTGKMKNKKASMTRA